MSLDFLQAIVRLLMNVIAGALAAKGIGDASTWEQVSAGAIALSALGWSAWHQRRLKSSVAKLAAVSDSKPNESTPSCGTGPPHP